MYGEEARGNRALERSHLGPESQRLALVGARRVKAKARSEVHAKQARVTEVEQDQVEAMEEEKEEEEKEDEAHVLEGDQEVDDAFIAGRGRRREDLFGKTDS